MKFKFLILTLILNSSIQTDQNHQNHPNHQSNFDSFKESLLIKQFQDGKILTNFNFDLSSKLTILPSTSSLSNNLKLIQSDLFPLNLLELIHQFKINQLSLSLSRGRWELDRWSTHSIKNQKIQSYPSGAELAIWLENSNSLNISSLSNTLAGIFCSSLNRLHLSSNLPHSFFPFSSFNHSQSTFYHGILPIEKPCTENLSPLLKLLPCRSHAGLANLINPHNLFNSNWQSLRFKLFKKHSSLNLQIEIENVSDPLRKNLKRDWDLVSIFGKSIEKICPLAQSSLIEIIHDHQNQHHPRIEPLAHQSGKPINGCHTYDLLKAVLPLEIEAKWLNEQTFSYPKSFTPSPINLKRLLFGHGQTRGSIGIEIQVNNQFNHDHEMVYVDQLPWWLSIYLHTLKVEIDGVRLNPAQIIKKQFIQPSLQRQRPYLIVMTIQFPPNSTKLNQIQNKRKLKIQFDYEKDLLLYTEYPSDANRGFDLNPAAILISDHQNSTQNNHQDHHQIFYKRYWTNSALIDLATPDFSMPYNVIIVTSTAIALFFGSVFNLLVREFKLIKLT